MVSYGQTTFSIFICDSETKVKMKKQSGQVRLRCYLILYEFMIAVHVFLIECIIIIYLTSLVMNCHVAQNITLATKMF